MDLLSIVIVNWNSSDFAVDCIASLHATTTDVPFEVIVVDNASTENVSRIVDVHPGVRLLASHQNLGFARANNLGVEQSQGRWILFLNPDTIVLKNAIRVMLSNLESHAEVGAVGCRLLNGDMTLQMSSVQRFPTILNQLLSLDVLKRRWPKARLWGTSALFTDSPVAVDVVSGACLMVKREVFEQAGRFSPDYFLYHEDTDLSLRL
ncbi:MAG: glycosyltransferase family 2 protein, partial [Bryobacteraceae bacterium]